MMKKMIAFLFVLLLIFSLSACGAGTETTRTGMVVSVEGTVISLMEIDTANMGDRNFANGERPQMPEGMELPDGLDPNAMTGTLPEGETFPQWGDGEKPDMPKGMFIPENGEKPKMPEGMTIPEDAEKPADFADRIPDGETIQVDIANAHISVEIDGGKASGSIEDIKTGSFVTVTLNGKNEATNVLVSSMSGFSGGRRTEN